MPTDVIRPTPAALLAATRGSVTDLLKPAATGAYRDLRRPKSRTAPVTVPRTTFDPTLPDNIANPYPALAQIRQHPVVVNEALGVWMLGRYEDVHAAARDSASFSSTDGILLRSFGASAVVFAQPPDHTRLRRVAAPMFNKRAVADLTSGIRELAEAGAAPLRTGDVVDLVQSLTIPMPINVIAQMLGIPRGKWVEFRSMSEHFAGIFGPRTTAEIVRVIGTGLPAYVRFRTLIAAEMNKRAVEPADDLLTRFQTAGAAGELSDTEAFVYAFLLLVAGNETTTNLLGMLLLRLAKDQKLFAELKADRSLIPAAVEETARWGSPVQWVSRTLTANHRIGDTVIPCGARTLLFYSSANRDPEKFANPDTFDIHRDTTGHLAFGHGLHFCLGAHLARLEVAIAVEQLLEKAHGMELAGPVKWATTPSLQGPSSLPVRLRPIR
ncbi:MAG: cytochrome P450 [Mycobacterium sp.]